MYIETLNIFKYIYKHINLLANIISMNVLIALDKFYNLILDFESLQEKLEHADILWYPGCVLKHVHGFTLRELHGNWSLFRQLLTASFYLGDPRTSSHSL